MSTNISQSLLPEFDVEIANTRKTLERVPESNPDFRPHPKSMTLARLAGHNTTSHPPPTFAPPNRGQTPIWLA